LRDRQRPASSQEPLIGVAWNLVTEPQPENRSGSPVLQYQVFFQVGCLEAFPKLSYLPSLTIVQAGGSNMATGEDL
jgi:hypothetical protein